MLSPLSLAAGDQLSFVLFHRHLLFSDGETFAALIGRDRAGSGQEQRAWSNLWRSSERIEAGRQRNNRPD